jgi:predicted MFS family arabinose efflux permease
MCINTAWQAMCWLCASSLTFFSFPTYPTTCRGRRNASLAYVVTYSLSCVTKHSPEFHILMLGRILGGIATSLLYSAFESWLVAEHFKRGYSGERHLLPLAQTAMHCVQQQ